MRWDRETEPTGYFLCRYADADPTGGIQHSFLNSTQRGWCARPIALWGGFVMFIRTCAYLRLGTLFGGGLYVCMVCMVRADQWMYQVRCILAWSTEGLAPELLKYLRIQRIAKEDCMQSISDRMSHSLSLHRILPTGGLLALETRPRIVHWVLYHSLDIIHNMDRDLSLGLNVGYRSVDRLKPVSHSRDNKTQVNYINILIVIAVFYLLH